MEEGRVRAYGAAGDIAERYLNEVNLLALANQQVPLQSHRGGTGELRYTAIDITQDNGLPITTLAQGATLVVKASYRTETAVERPVFQIAIIDVDTGLVITTATSSPADSPERVTDEGSIECRFERVPLRPRQYALRLSITDSHQLVSYDLVSAGPRFAIVGRGLGVDSLADEEDGLVSLPFTFDHRRAAAAARRP